MAGLLDIIGGLISSVVPKSIYDPSTGAILGGALSGITGGTVAAAAPARGLTPFDTGGSSFADMPLEAPRYGMFDGAAAPDIAPGEPWRSPDVLAIPASLSPVPFGVSNLPMPMGGPSMALARRVLPGIAKVVASAVLLYGGEKLATSIYSLYVNLRRQGHSHKRARRLAHQAHGVGFRRRRMRPTNVHALRRAIRRVHGFKRIARKVGALGTSSRGRFMHPRRHYRRARRGDVGPFMVEDYADMLDEAEDFDLDGEGFSESAVGE